MPSFLPSFDVFPAALTRRRRDRWAVVLGDPSPFLVVVTGFVAVVPVSRLSEPFSAVFHQPKQKEKLGSHQREAEAIQTGEAC